MVPKYTNTSQTTTHSQLPRLARLWMRLTTYVNDPSEHRYTRFKLPKATMQQRLFLRAEAQPQVYVIPKLWTVGAAYSCGYNGCGRNSVPHQRCMGTGNSIWTSRTHQLRRPLLHQVVRIKALPVGKHPTKFLRAEAQPLSGGTTTIT